MCLLLILLLGVQEFINNSPYAKDCDYESYGGEDDAGGTVFHIP
jgi:hypothetical protein